MHINIYISAGFCLLCFPPLSLLLLRRSAIQEPKTKIPASSLIDNYLYNFYYYTDKSCQDLGACLVGFLVAFSPPFFLNATWPLVTRRACIWSWTVKMLSLLPLLAQQLGGQRRKYKSERWTGTWIAQKLSSQWLYSHTNHSCTTINIAEDSKDDSSITPMTWKVRKIF